MRTQAYVCVIAGGIEVAIVRPVYGKGQHPARMTDSEQDAAVHAALVAAYRDPVFAIDADDALALLTVTEDGEPTFSSFSGAYMDTVRAEAGRTP